MFEAICLSFWTAVLPSVSGLAVNNAPLPLAGVAWVVLGARNL